MNLTLRRITAALLALWGVSVLLVDGRIGWALLVLVGAWLLWRRPTPTPPLAAARHAAAGGRPVTRAVTPVEPVPYWLLPTAAVAGAAAVMHGRDQPAAADSEEPAEEEACEESYDVAGYAAPAAAGWDGVDDADAGFGGFGGGGGWGPGADFGGSGGGGDWGDGMGDDFGGFGGGGDWGGGDDW